MTDAEKLTYLKTLLGLSGTDYDTELDVYLTLTKQEILNWKYMVSGGVPDGVSDVPPEDEVTQVMACAAGYGHKGGIDEIQHNENGISRIWKHADMVAYVRSNVIAYAGVGA